MKTVRTSVFETNSSSMHAIVIPKDSFFSEKPVDVCMDGNMDFSERTLIERNTASEKASYCLHLITDHWQSKLVHGKWSSELYKYMDITDDEVELNRTVIAAYRKFISFMKREMKRYWKINLTIKNVSISCTKHGASIKSTEYASNGCYGHRVLTAILMSVLFKTIDEIAKPGADVDKILKDPSRGDWLNFYEMASFILNPSAVIIQNTDECSMKDLKHMQRMVIDYVKKNNGMCLVDWPLGG